MARDRRLDELKRIREKVEKLAGRTISEVQLLAAIDHPEIINSICERVRELGFRHHVYRGACLNIAGWTARIGSEGYYRLYKTIEGRTESIYLGKRLDWEKAHRKISKKEKKLGLSYW